MHDRHPTITTCNQFIVSHNNNVLLFVLLQYKLSTLDTLSKPHDYNKQKYETFVINQPD